MKALTWLAPVVDCMKRSCQEYVFKFGVDGFDSALLPNHCWREILGVLCNFEMVSAALQNLSCHRFKSKIPHLKGYKTRWTPLCSTWCGCQTFLLSPSHKSSHTSINFTLGLIPHDSLTGFWNGAPPPHTKLWEGGRRHIRLRLQPQLTSLLWASNEEPSNLLYFYTFNKVQGTWKIAKRGEW